MIFVFLSFLVRFGVASYPPSSLPEQQRMAGERSIPPSAPFVTHPHPQFSFSNYSCGVFHLVATGRLFYLFRPLGNHGRGTQAYELACINELMTLGRNAGPLGEAVMLKYEVLGYISRWRGSGDRLRDQWSQGGVWAPCVSLPRIIFIGSYTESSIVRLPRPHHANADPGRFQSAIQVARSPSGMRGAWATTGIDRATSRSCHGAGGRPRAPTCRRRRPP